MDEEISPQNELLREVAQCLLDCVDFACDSALFSLAIDRNLTDDENFCCSFLDALNRRYFGSEFSTRAESRSDHDFPTCSRRQPVSDDEGGSAFSWEGYALASGACCVDPLKNFQHVDRSLAKFGQKMRLGQILAVSSDKRDASPGVKSFWLCEIEEMCGDWLLLMPLKSPGSNGPIWRHLRDQCFSVETAVKNGWTAEAHFCAGVADWATLGEEGVAELLGSSKCVSEVDFEQSQNSLSPEFALAQEGHFVDVQEVEADPRRFWICKILRNVGGRLLLEYAGVEKSAKNENCAEFWEFYSSEKIHPVGSAARPEFQSLYGWHYDVPVGLKQISSINEILDIALKNSTPKDFFRHRKQLRKHDFEADMKLEALHPFAKTQFFPASVVEILNDFYFVVELDTTYGNNGFTTASHDPVNDYFLDSPGLFPVGWCALRHLRLAVSDEFDWTVYMKKKGGKMMHEHHFELSECNTNHVEFHRGEKLECVYPSHSKDKICIATVIRFVNPLVWVAFDFWPEFSVPMAFHCSDPDLLPCGWCQTFDYPLVSPNFRNLLEITKINDDLVHEVNATYLTYERKMSDVPGYAYMPRSLMPKYGCQWAPTIYLNPKCYIGPYICRCRFSEMPRRVGPGPLQLVLKNVLRHVISSSYRPRDLFIELQPDILQAANPRREIVEVKAKYRGKRYRGQVEICTKIEHVEEWCRQLCNVIDACPKVVSLKPTPTDSSCPYQCCKALKSKHAGVVKCLSLLAAKKLDKRLKSRRRQHQQRNNPLQLAPSTPKEGQLGRVAAQHVGQLQQSPSAAGGCVTRPQRNHFFKRRNSNVGSTPPRRPMTRRLARGPKFDFATRRPTTRFTVSKNPENTGASVIRVPPVAPPLHADQQGAGQQGAGELLTIIMTQCPFGARQGRIPTPSIVELSPHFHVDPLNLNSDSSSSVPNLHLNIPAVTSNPLHWSYDDLCVWLMRSELCKNIAARLKDELVDGQAFMLLTLQDVQNFLGLKLGPALKLCEVVKQLKLIYLTNYVDSH